MGPSPFRGSPWRCLFCEDAGVSVGLRTRENPLAALAALSALLVAAAIALLFFYYGAYFMLRYSIEPGPARANMCAVYALFGVVLIPISFLAIRLANQLIHPVVFTLQGPQMAGSMFLTFCVSLAAMLSLAATFFHIELAGKRIDSRLRELRELLA